MAQIFQQTRRSNQLQKAAYEIFNPKRDQLVSGRWQKTGKPDNDNGTQSATSNWIKHRPRLDCRTLIAASLRLRLLPFLYNRNFSLAFD